MRVVRILMLLMLVPRTCMVVLLNRRASLRTLLIATGCGVLWVQDGFMKDGVTRCGAFGTPKVTQVGRKSRGTTP